MSAFAIGKAVEPKALSRDPYRIFAEMRAKEPVSFVEAFGLYYITLHEDVSAVLRDDVTYGVGSDDMLVFDTFGRHMMTIDGEEHNRYRLAMRAPFTVKYIRERLETQIAEIVDALIDGFEGEGRVELRSAFACRLPVQVMLAVFGLPREDEPLLRRWYDAFEASLGNYEWDEEVRARGKHCVEEFKQHLQMRLDEWRGKEGEANLLAALVNDAPERRLSDEEILRNALIIFFGGISTVEALVLNAFYALARHPETFARVKADHALIPTALEETVRWLSPVQAVTRYVRKEASVRGVTFKEGDIVNCMIGSANRDERVFAEPDRFDISRPDLGKHIAFATGPHTCLGLQLARAEGRIALSRLFSRLDGCTVDLDATAAPEGYEFRQPRALHLVWNARQ
ncbi:MAG TPA: cytochrome P450 [Parvularculaceae bacterium]|nr:cytochrome P450 [Parvularculaceae bacterium]